jgi:hypothetical protein
MVSVGHHTPEGSLQEKTIVSRGAHSSAFSAGLLGDSLRFKILLESMAPF